jgi:hypothetical protein
MKKRPSRKTSGYKKKIETLENQSFAQKLMIDELEKRLEQLEQRTTNPWAPFGAQPNINAAPPFTLTPPDPCIDPVTGQQHVAHTWPLGNTFNGTAMQCSVCGKYLTQSNWTTTVPCTNVALTPAKVTFTSTSKPTDSVSPLQNFIESSRYNK